ncbi:unnamed protein product [Symbiodinium microadriaticum]|nr:unnamed protein product [Symbiodinium sp. KB8]CAE7170679.1 unnamed protein product [Symbiodinium microadriaticum]
METEMAAAKKEGTLGTELVRGQRQLEELQSQSFAQEELREELRSLGERNEALREQLRTLHQETRKVSERVDREVADHIEVQRHDVEANKAKLGDSSEIRRQLAQASSRTQELQTLKDQSERALEASKKSSHRTEDLARQLHQLQEDLGASLRERNQLHEAVEQLTVQFREDVFRQSQRHLELEGLIEDRNNEIKLLMYRLQELSSRYVPVKADATDMVLSRWINGYRPAVPFFRLAQGLYLFGRRQVVCKISNDKPVFRIGGGFVGFEKFLEQFAAEELERLLTYELDEKTGEPKFLVAKQLLEESGMVEEIRQKVTEDVQRGKTGLQSSMSKKSLNSSRGSL